MNDLAHDIQLIQAWAAANPIVDRVWIFGSRCRGNHEPDSDLEVAVQHGIAHGDSDLSTSGLFEPKVWRSQLQPHARLRLDVQSHIPGDTPTVEAALRESSRLIYERIDEMV